MFLSLRSIHNDEIITDISHCNPVIPCSHNPSINRKLRCQSHRLPKVVYTIMNKRDLKTCIRNFLFLWKFLRERNASLISHFVSSRIFRVHQNHVNVFLHLYTLMIVEYVRGINYRLFLDLICKLVVDYQDCKLIKENLSRKELGMA